MESFIVPIILQIRDIIIIYNQKAKEIRTFYWYSLRDDATDVLCIAEWNGIISFYTIGGEVIKKERSFNFIPLKVTHFAEGQYLLVCGSNKQCLLLTHDGIQLVKVGDTFSSWVWSCAVHPTASHVVSYNILFMALLVLITLFSDYLQALGSQDGTITYLQLSWNIVHGLYGDRYAYRENMTDVIIQHLITNQKVRIKCKDLVSTILAKMIK